MNKKPTRVRKGVKIDQRSVAQMDLIQRFLIVCEGERTEPYYFQSFRVPKEVVSLSIVGTGYNTMSLVRHAVALKTEDDYDQVWCVFDRDSFPVQDFNNALSFARHNNINVAYSNEAFELWYLLHFHFYQTGISRADYINKLTNLLGREYQKNMRDIYQILEDRQDIAMQNAERLLNIYKPCMPSRDNPSTTVHLLVKELKRFTR